MSNWRQVAKPRNPEISTPSFLLIFDRSHEGSAARSWFRRGRLLLREARLQAGR